MSDDESPLYVVGHELIAAYMKLHPKWTTRGMGPDTFGCGVVWIETWESRVIARAQYHVSDPAAVEAGICCTRTRSWR